MIRNKAILLIFRVVLGGLFVYAGIVKVLDAPRFRPGHPQLPARRAVAVLHRRGRPPWLEILSGLFLIAGVWKRGAALVISGLLVFFVVLTVVTMIRGLDVDCGCFGALSRKAGLSVILEDLAMLYLGLCLLFAAQRKANLGESVLLPPN